MSEGGGSHSSKDSSEMSISISEISESRLKNITKVRGSSYNLPHFEGRLSQFTVTDMELSQEEGLESQEPVLAQTMEMELDQNIDPDSSQEKQLEQCKDFGTDKNDCIETEPAQAVEPQNMEDDLGHPVEPVMDQEMELNLTDDESVHPNLASGLVPITRPGVSDEACNYLCLFNRLFTNGESLRLVAESWKNIYARSRPLALQQLLELFFNCTGWVCEISLNDMLSLLKLNDYKEIDDWIEHKEYSMIEQRIKEMMLVKKDRLLSLILTPDVLMKLSFMAQLNRLLEVLISSHVIDLRRISISTGVQISMACVKFVNEQMDHMEVDRKQYNNICTAFEKCVLNTLRGLMDKDLKIRQYMCTHFTNWLTKYPRIFLKGVILKHLVSNLKDPHMSLREHHLQTICDVLQKREWEQNGLIMFIRHAIEDVKIRTDDECRPVSLLAIEALRIMYRLTGDLKIKNFLCKLVLNGNTFINQEGALFLRNEILMEVTSNSNFLFELVKFAGESEREMKKYLIHSALVKAMMVCSRDVLLDWQAWTELLLEDDSFDQRRQMHGLACRMLVSALEFATTADSEEDVERLTLHFGKVLVKILQKYKGNYEAFTHLLAIPQRFNKLIETVPDMHDLVYLLFSLKGHSVASLDNCMASLCVLHSHFNGSERYSLLHVTIEYQIVQKTTDWLREALREYMTCSENRDLMLFLVPKKVELFRKAIAVVSNFDMEGQFRKASLTLLQVAVTKKHIELVKFAVFITFHSLDHMLERVVEYSKAGTDTSKIYVAKVMPGLKAYMKNLETTYGRMLSHKTFAIRTIGFDVLSRMYLKFNPNNELLEGHADLHMIIKSSNAEWFHYHVYTLLNYHQVHKDDERYATACRVLKQFCDMIKGGALNPGYLNAVMPYFAFYFEDRNYNEPLVKLVQDLFKRHDRFTDIVVEGLMNLVHADRITEQMLQPICQGFAQCLSELKPSEKAKSQMVSIVTECIIIAGEANYPYILPLVAPIASYITEKRKANLWTLMQNSLEKFLDDADAEELKRVLQPRTRKDARKRAHV